MENFQNDEIESGDELNDIRSTSKPLKKKRKIEQDRSNKVEEKQ